VAKVTDKEYLKIWEQHKRNFSNLDVDYGESFTEKKRRIADLEKNPEKWFRYYFERYYLTETEPVRFIDPAPFHVTATKRVLAHPEWFELRAWSRELAKSTRTMMEICYLAVTGRKKNVLLVSNSAKNAERLLAPFKAFFEFNKRLLHDYGGQKTFGEWISTEFTTKKGCAFRSLGWGESPRGTRKDNIRPDVILIDDIDTDEECRNEDIQQNKLNWIEQALIPTRSISNPLLIIVCGNIISDNCMINRLSDHCDILDIVNIRDDKGKSTWKSKNSEEMIDRVLAGISYESAQKEYFNNPMDGTELLKSISFRTIPDLKTCRCLIYADPSTSNRDVSSGSEKAVFLLAQQKYDYFVVRGFLSTMTTAKFVESMYDLYLYAKREGVEQVFVYIENNSLQNPFFEQVLLPQIYQRGSELKTFLPVTPDVREKKDKYTRIEGTLEPLVRLGHLFLNEAESTSPDMVKLKAQFKNFAPRLKRMDGLDAVEGGVYILQEKEMLAQTTGIELFQRRKEFKI